METNNRKQLVTQDNGNIEKIFPKNYMSNIVDEETGESLRIFLLKYNHIDLGYRSSKSSARLAVPIIMRRKGLYITYYLPDDVVITEFFNGNKTEVSDTNWVKDELWVKDVNELNVYDVKISDGSITLDKLSEEVMQLISSKGDITINNFPDNEDLELYTIYQDSNNKIDAIRFKDRNNSNGMAYKYLRKTKNMILSQSDFNQANTIYEIRYDFDLNGSTISIPNNCELKFVGGSLNNGSINFNNILLSGDIKINTEILGSLKNNKIEVNWFNVDNTGNIDSTNIINKILEISSGKEVIFNGTYKVNPIASNSKEYDGGIRPVSNQTLRFQENTKIIIDSQNTSYYSIISIYKVSNVNIIGAIVEGDISTHLTNEGEFGFGFAISSSKNINLYNCVSNNNWGDGYIFLSTGTEETNNFNCNLYNCEAHYNRRQGLSIVALYEGNIDNFKASNTGILKYTAPAAGIDIEPDAIRYDERIKVTINNYISENNFGGALHIVPAHLMHDNVTDDHREFYVQVNGLSSNLDGSRDTSVLLPALRYSSVSADSNLSNKIKGLVELNNITISNSYMNPLEFRNMVDNGLPIIINDLVVLNPKTDSSFAKSMSAVLKFYNPTTYDYTNSVKLTINNIKVTDTRVDNRTGYLIFSTFGNSPKNIHLFNVDNPSMEGGTNIPYFIDDSSEVEYNPLPIHVVDDDTNFLLANTSNNYWGYRIIFNNPSTKSFRLPKGSTVTNFKIIVENIQKDNVVHSRFIAGDKINEPLIYNIDPSLELIPYSSIKFIQEKDQSWNVYKSTDDIIPTLNPYFGINKNAIQEGSNLRLGHSYYDTKLNTTLNYGKNGWENPDGTYINKVSIISDITNIVSSNTIYKIVFDIDLGGTTLTLPANCTLDFQGGSFSNGTIVGSNTKIESGLTKIFGTDITLSGTWIADSLSPEHFGIIGIDATQDTTYIQKALDCCSAINIKTVKLQNKTYQISSSLLIQSNIKLEGAASRVWNNGSATILSLAENVVGITVESTGVEINDLKITGNTTNTGISFTNRSYYFSGNRIITAGLGIGFDIQSSWTYIFNLCRIEGGTIGFKIQEGTSGTFNSCVAFSCTEYGFYVTKLNYGSFNGCGTDGCKYGFYFTDACRGVTLSSCGCENTQVGGYMVKCGARAYVTITAFSVGTMANVDCDLFIFEADCRVSLIDLNVGSLYHSTGNTLNVAKGAAVTLINCYLTGTSVGLENCSVISPYGNTLKYSTTVDKINTKELVTSSLATNATYTVLPTAPLNSVYLITAVTNGNSAARGLAIVTIPTDYGMATVDNLVANAICQISIDATGNIIVTNTSVSVKAYKVSLLKLI